MADKSLVTFSILSVLSQVAKGFNDCVLTTMKKFKRQLVLNKGAERFIFRYENGCEDELLDALIDQAKDDRTSFDWFDAAVLSFKLTQLLVGQADELLGENKDAQFSAN